MRSKPSVPKFSAKLSVAELNKIFAENIRDTKGVGRDGLSPISFQRSALSEIRVIIRKVSDGSYRFTFFRPLMRLRGAEKKPRVLSVPTVRDRILLRALNDYLCECLPDARPWLPHKSVGSIKNWNLETNQDKKFIRADIENFFPSINHKKLLKKLKGRVDDVALTLIQRAITTPTIGDSLEDCGVPQGLSISNILSNFYLLDLDKEMGKEVQYVRYVDDILMMSDPDHAESHFSSLAAKLKRLSLKAHPLNKGGKSEIHLVSRGVNYLGFNFSAKRVKVKEESFARMISKILGVFTRHKHSKNKSQAERVLVWKLNLKITGCVFDEKRYGWVFYFSEIDNLEQLGRLDALIRSELASRNLGHLATRIKSFIRAYNEINFRFNESEYFPRFDIATHDQMVQILSDATGVGRELYDQMDDQQLEQEFRRLIKRSVRQLEVDTKEVRDDGGAGGGY